MGVGMGVGGLSLSSWRASHLGQRAATRLRGGGGLLARRGARLERRVRVRVEIVSPQVEIEIEIEMVQMVQMVELLLLLLLR